MKDEQVLITKELRMRITELEYKNLPKEEMIQAVEQIYLEEMGKQLPGEINVYTSSESPKLENDDSSYDGTAIHFHSEENDINEVYIISQGTQGGEDWSYNIESMFAGQSIAQAEATQNFTVDALQNFDIEVDSGAMDQVEVPVVGLSHSLAHNNNTTSYLLYDTFSKVHSVNGAQTNYYQLFFADPDFEDRLIEDYPDLEVFPDGIYDLPPKELETIAKDFYDDKAQNIYQDYSVQDPLYAVSGVRGFFTLGEAVPHDTSEDHSGLRELIDKIPDDTVVALQELAIDYTVAKENGSTVEMIKDLTGLEMEVVEKFDGVWGSISTYFSNDFTEMLPDVNEKLPDLLENVQLITNHSDTIFDELMNADYITKGQRDDLVETFSNIEKELLIIQESLTSLESYRELEGVQTEDDYMMALGGDIGTGINMYRALKRLQGLFDELTKDEYQEILDMIAASHGISEMINALGGDKKTYLNDDMLLAPTSGAGGREIWINISAALRMYVEGKAILEEREDEIERLKETIDVEVDQHFENEKQKLLDKIADIEENSSSYIGMVQSHVDSTVKGVERMVVYEAIDPLTQADHDDELESLEMSVTDGYTFIERYRSAVEDMFDEDARIAERFDLAEAIMDD